jgi:prepilin-type N-terminal cleavage/methylation domain-containing protein/prepilin-type processing-associated H-X9-DG protein
VSNFGAPGAFPQVREGGGAVPDASQATRSGATRMPGQRHFSRTARAFTLIELLVVVAIIALLISILLPALSRARQQAKQGKCGANLHSIGQAVHECFTENKGYGPTWDDGRPGDQPGEKGAQEFALTWVDLLFDLGFLGDVRGGVCPTDERPDEVMAIRATHPVWGTPTPYRFVENMGVGETPKDGMRSSYALSVLMHYNFPKDKHPDAARQVYAIDGWWSWFGCLSATWLMRQQFGDVGDPITEPHHWATMVGWRHGTDFSANTLYVDGHVALLTPRAVANPDELGRKSVDTVQSFTWLPGELNDRIPHAYYLGDVQEWNPPNFIFPAWVDPRNTGRGGKLVAGKFGPYSEGHVHPFSFPEELSCAWRTNNDAWAQFPNNSDQRR